jgi:uncharacterized membrane protein YvbJ
VAIVSAAKQWSVLTEEQQKNQLAQRKFRSMKAIVIIISIIIIIIIIIRAATIT